MSSVVIKKAKYEGEELYLHATHYHTNPGAVALVLSPFEETLDSSEMVVMTTNLSHTYPELSEGSLVVLDVNAYDGEKFAGWLKENGVITEQVGIVQSGFVTYPIWSLEEETKAKIRTLLR